MNCLYCGLIGFLLWTYCVLVQCTCESCAESRNRSLAIKEAGRRIMVVTMGQAGAEASHERRQCTATAHSTGLRCRRVINSPDVVCGLHGAKRSDMSRKLAFDGLDEVTRLKLYDPEAPAVTNPYAELQQLGGVARNAVDVAGQKVNELESWSSHDAEGRSQVKADVQLFTQLMKFSESVLSTLAKLKVDEKVAEIQQARVALISAALERAFATVPLSIEQRSALDAAFAGELRAITAGHDTDSADDATLLSLVEQATQRGGT